MVQGDIISPVFFIISLDQLVQKYDKSGTGISVGHIKDIRVLGYADNAAMTEWHVEDMSKRLTEFSDAALAKADMKVKVSKTFSQMVCKQVEVGKITEQEIKAKTASYKYACTYEKAGCTQRFKTKRGMAIHAGYCSFNYGLEDEPTPLERIVDVFGKSARKLFLVQWEGFPGQDSWIPADALVRDGCTESIKDFWTRTGKRPALDFYPDADGDPGMRCWMCGWKSDKQNKPRGL